MRMNKVRRKSVTFRSIERSAEPMKPPMRTYTKIQKFGSVERSIDVTRYRDYLELRSAITSMFGLQGKLEHPASSDWKLVYVDYENDVLLVGDDPWEEFINCVSYRHQKCSK